MKNDYVTEGDTIRVFLRDGFEMLMDLDDLPKLMQFRGTIYPQKRRNYTYASINIYQGNYHNSIYVHQIILDNIPDNYEIDHIHHNGMDNRKSELRAVPRSANDKNRRSKNPNNSAGYRNVCWSNNNQRYLVTLQVNGKAQHFGSFKNAEEAGKVAKEMRAKLYGEYAGND